ncbi:MAG: family 43 glycosylhydrolase [Clostridiales bacterium]|nr:family 43 glycosylhydrolase [Clostridiales bacterium]
MGTKIDRPYRNPFILQRADPYIIKSEDGYYYFTGSYPMTWEGDPNGYDRIVLRRSHTLEGLADAEEIVVWKTRYKGKSHRFIWAPELHYIGGKWYLLFAASSTVRDRWDINCHIMQCQSQDPYTGKWKEYGKLKGTSKDDFSFTQFSLDMTYFECKGRHFLIWAQHSRPDRISCLYMAEIDPIAPWQLISMPMLLTQPEYPWEKVRFAVNEGPSVLKHDGKIFVCFSASGTGPEYCVGLLEADENSEMLDPASWKKYDKPLLTSADLPDEFGPGHNSFTVDDQGRDVFVYHARSKECYLRICGYTCADPLYDPCRHARLQNVIWSKAGTPILNGVMED